MLKQTEKSENYLLSFLGMILFVIWGLFNCGVEIKPIGPSQTDCKRIEGLPGPEDLAIDREERILYISSHERRTKNQTGKIFRIDLKNPSATPEEIPVKYPSESYNFV